MTLKELDRKLQWLFTGFNYPKRLKTPLSRFLFGAGIYLFFAAFYFFMYISDGRIGWQGYFLSPLFLAGVYYHFRLFKEEKANSLE